MKTDKNMISVIIPVFNSASTIMICLSSLKKQSIPVKEVIFIDNHSSDNSKELIERYQKKEKMFKIVLIKKSQTTSVGSSYNLALKRARGQLIVAMHSDSSLPTKNELSNLIKPLLNNPQVMASYSYVLHPKEIWDKYNFWERCQSARVVGKRIPGMNGKFDCYRKEVLLKLNGFDDVNFDQYGDGNDADIFYRLSSFGKVAATDAEVVHLHYLKNDYRFQNWLEKRKNMSITAGRLFKMYFFKKDTKRQTVFLLRPVLAILPFLPYLHIIGAVLVLIYAFLYLPRMFITISLWKNPRLYLLPFINIFLIYYESFWFIYAIITLQVKTKRKL